MNNAGFYKKTTQEILYAPNIVEGQGYMLLIDDKDKYNYPVDGWIYADSLDSAISYFASSAADSLAPFDVQPENFKLSAIKEDQTEFGKLVTLLNLGLQQNRFQLTTEITIWDYIGEPHFISIERFLQVMLDYGMYCYSQRS